MSAHRRFYIASFPRSGNTLFRLAMEHFFGIKTEEPRGKITRMNRAVRMERDGKKIVCRNDFEGIKTHGVDGENIPAFFIVRDPRDALLSLIRYLRVSNPDDLPLEKEIRRVFAWRPRWNEMVHYWYHFHPGNVALYRYEDMQKSVARRGGIEFANLIAYGFAALFPDAEPLRRITDEPFPKFEYFQRNYGRINFHKGTSGQGQVAFDAVTLKKIFKQNRQGLIDCRYISSDAEGFEQNFS